MTVVERFTKYVSFPTASDENSDRFPSTPGQSVLGEYLTEELRSLGLQNARMDDFGYVYGYLPGSEGHENDAPLGFIAHMDTSPDAPGSGIRPAIIHYTGGDIPLSGGSFLCAADYPKLKNYVNCDLIVTDGTTLLGADDKAGVAEIVTMLEYYVTHKEAAHRPLAICFTPDEEIGCGTDHFPFDEFAAQVAYTVDGGELGEIEYENFNAASAVVEITGRNIHPGEGKNKLKNAALLAAEWICALPAAETPAHTEGYEGFYHVTDVAGSESHATVKLIIRDHDRERFEARKAFVRRLCEYLNGVYGAGTFTAAVKDSYYNMREMILPHMELVDNAERAMTAAGITPKVVPIRGGTDGARLSYEGIPCPNLSTGGINFHSVHEFIPVHALTAMVEVLKELAKA